MSSSDRDTRSKPRREAKPYAKPKVIRYGHVKDIVQGTGGGGQDGANHSKVCWIAEALYGAGAPRTLLVRAWLLDAEKASARWSIFVVAYRAFGERIARGIASGVVPRRPFIAAFDRLVARASIHYAERLRGR